MGYEPKFWCVLRRGCFEVRCILWALLAEMQLSYVSPRIQPAARFHATCCSVFEVKTININCVAERFSKTVAA